MMWANGACQNASWGTWMMFHGIFSLLLLLLAISGVVALIRLGLKLWSNNSDSRNLPASLEILERRYASGEIDREEYLQKKADFGA
ncbi:SHOCT domain-containing protein [Novosphingobium sp. NBM11]|uniref:SHOCT domain-containing protein n=1 Tax=Novosphingobium sp. NBM11 TaxID=2596914 RepID=UPI0018925986|nr:SHOCT domain-containing protein [Novosphingobium sp. NBM11]MBF5091085.1 SHOCT domain-containing protein [Novosphingobium sp. NBM11]